MQTWHIDMDPALESHVPDASFFERFFCGCPQQVQPPSGARNPNLRLRSNGWRDSAFGSRFQSDRHPVQTGNEIRPLPSKPGSCAFPLSRSYRAELGARCAGLVPVCRL